MKKAWIAVSMAILLLLTACSNRSVSGQGENRVESEGVGRTDMQSTERMPESDNGIFDPDPTIEAIPAAYKNEPDEAGTVVRLDYRTASYSDPEEKQDKYAYVYLPYGYGDENSYDILYLMHGGGGSAETCFGGEGQSSELKCILDNLIANGEMKPLIVVTPTFYPAGNADASVSYAGDLVKLFPDELVNDLVPAVESVYSTYADSTDADGLKASREHRAFGGFSMGSVTTWYTFMEKLDYFKYFLPISGDCWAVEMQGGRSAAEETAEALRTALQESGYGTEDFYIYEITGSDDIAYPMMQAQTEAMSRLSDTFVFSRDEGAGNICFCVKDGGVHDYANVRQYLYNMLPDLWGED
ncbi:MAG: alpha/beta hydrolase-fold protein [Muribaculaceae bacterium]|nr:alpha/beta hydrolase-fold protein [Muribaculaceae bacterium]